MNDFLMENCCESAEDVINAEKSGAYRAELNSCLYAGGLTPSFGTFLEAKEKTSKIKILVMIRPRMGGFCYSEEDFLVMKRDAKLFLDAGADGIVFGFLKPDGTVDEARVREMTALAGDKETVFHRAIDVVPDRNAALDTLIRCKVTRVLTSGGKKDAYTGRFQIRDMAAHAAGRIEILPGAGIREENFREILDVTGVSALHMTKRRNRKDTSMENNPEIRFIGDPAYDESIYRVVDPEK